MLYKQWPASNTININAILKLYKNEEKITSTTKRPSKDTGIDRRNLNTVTNQIKERRPKQENKKKNAHRARQHQ